jgi:hypothetical protein
MATQRRFNKIFNYKKEARSCEVLLFFANAVSVTITKINTNK